MFFLQVEFGPTFEETPMSDEWSWDQNPINLTCIATAIPNATITWWIRDREIGREELNRNYEVSDRRQVAGFFFVNPYWEV